MTTSPSFVSIPRDDRDVADLEVQLRQYAGVGAVVVGGAAGDGKQLLTVRVPSDPEQRGHVLHVISAWRDRTAETATPA